VSESEPFLQQIRNTANVTLDVIIGNLNSNINTAYTQANSSYVQANSAYTEANIAYIEAANAYGQANAAYTQANVASVIAQAAYGQANLGIGIAEAAYGEANTAISASGVTAGTYGSGVQIPVVTFDARGRALHAVNQSLAQFSPTTSGVVPPSGGGTTNFIRADGQWASPAAIASQLLGGNGYVKLSSGLILQWGTANFGTGGIGNQIFFPTAFSTCYAVVATRNGTNLDAPAFGVNNINSSYFYGVCDTGSNNLSACWIAIGS
jgi:hypothetical protein